MFRLYIILAIITVISTGSFFAYRFVNNLITENATLSANNIVLENSLASSQAANEALQNDVKLMNNITIQLQTEYDSARSIVNDLEDKLSKHEIGYLAKSKPKLVENIVNNASRNIGRCFEIATGSPLTQAESNATKPSEINNECPSLANPKYKETK